MKTLQILISLWGILVTAQAQQSDRPAAMPTPPRTVGRLLFNGMSDDPKTVPVEKIDFQINTVDLGHRTTFLKLGDMIPNTLFKLTKFEYKIRRDASTGIDEDVSELTIKNSKTGATVVLVFQKTIDATAAGAAK